MIRNPAVSRSGRAPASRSLMCGPPGMQNASPGAWLPRPVPFFTALGLSLRDIRRARGFSRTQSLSTSARREAERWRHHFCRRTGRWEGPAAVSPPTGRDQTRTSCSRKWTGLTRATRRRATWSLLVPPTDTRFWTQRDRGAPDRIVHVGLPIGPTIAILRVSETSAAARGCRFESIVGSGLMDGFSGADRPAWRMRRHQCSPGGGWALRTEHLGESREDVQRAVHRQRCSSGTRARRNVFDLNRFLAESVLGGGMYGPGRDANA